MGHQDQQKKEMSLERASSEYISKNSSKLSMTRAPNHQFATLIILVVLVDCNLLVIINSFAKQQKVNRNLLEPP